MSNERERPAGAPEALLVEGILDGRVQDPQALLAAVHGLDQCGAGTFRCDIAGGRFSLLPRDTHVASAAFDEAAQARFLAALQGVLAAAVAGSVEANLRCRMVYPTEVAETLFLVRGQHFEPVTRMRPRTAADARPATAASPAALFGLRRRELLIAAPLLFVGGGLLAWRSGLVDRVLAARAESLAIDTGPFGQLLAAKVERTWGNYRVELRRGADYPASPQALNERRDRAISLTERAAVDAVGNGQGIWVQLRLEDGKPIAATEVELRPLLGDAAALVTVELPGRMGAARLALSLSRDLAEPR